MTHTNIYWLFFLFLGNKYAAQITQIDSVVIRDPLLESHLVSQKILSINATQIHQNSTNLSENLRFQSPIFIKENGRGMASSPSVRGTSAQQSSFLWNGIPVNSLFLGQGDINTLGLLNYDKIMVKIGAGSLLLGSGAMGASVHLNNELTFNRSWNGTLMTEYGSFDTSNSAVRLGYGDDKLSVKLNASLSKSSNDYEIPEKNYINRNGQYEQLHYGISAGYRFGTQHEISMHSLYSSGTQHFPVFDATTTPTKYQTDGIKTLFNYRMNKERFSNQLSTSYIEDTFSYFGNIRDLHPSSGGTGKTILVRNLAQLSLKKPVMKLSFLAEYQRNEGVGYNSGIAHPKRDWASVYFGWAKKWSNDHVSEITIRKNFIQNIHSPLLFSLSNQLKINKIWTTYINISNNFRLPTFNDLYWQPGGNATLRPETAWQLEAMQAFNIQDFKIEIIPFLSLFKDKIQWIPTAMGYWAPTNFSKTKSYGTEVYLAYKKRFQNKELHLKANYSYTTSIDAETRLQNMYIPIHRASGMISFHARNWSIYAQGLYNGTTFTTTDEDKNNALLPYFVTNLGSQLFLTKRFSLSGKINNIFNQVYYTTAYYPLPMRNYSVQMAYQF